ELESWLNPVRVLIGHHLQIPADQAKAETLPGSQLRFALVAMLARREVPAVDRRRQELFLVELPELVDVRISLDNRVPELLLVVAEHLLLLDFLDVDVLHRVTHLVDTYRAADRIELQRGQLLDELLLARELALVFGDDLVDHLRS